MIDSSDSTRAAPPPLGREGFGGWGLGFGPCPAPLEGPWRSPGKGGGRQYPKICRPDPVAQANYSLGASRLFLGPDRSGLQISGPLVYKFSAFRSKTTKNL